MDGALALTGKLKVIAMTKIKKKPKPKPRPKKKAKRKQKPKIKSVAAMNKAIDQHFGNISAIAVLFGVSRPTVYKFIDDHPTSKTRLAESRDRGIDFAESKLFEGINNGVVALIIFYLKTQGKSRGYIERHEVDLTAPELKGYTKDANPDNWPEE